MKAIMILLVLATSFGCVSTLQQTNATNGGMHFKEMTNVGYLEVSRLDDGKFVPVVSRKFMRPVTVSRYSCLQDQTKECVSWSDDGSRDERREVVLQSGWTVDVKTVVQLAQEGASKKDVKVASTARQIKGSSQDRVLSGPKPVVMQSPSAAAPSAQVKKMSTSSREKNTKIILTVRDQKLIDGFKGKIETCYGGRVSEIGGGSLVVSLQVSYYDGSLRSVEVDASSLKTSDSLADSIADCIHTASVNLPKFSAGIDTLVISFLFLHTQTSST